MPAVLEVGSIADRRYHCSRRLRPNSSDLGNPLADLASFEDRVNLLIESSDAVVNLE